MLPVNDETCQGLNERMAKLENEMERIQHEMHSTRPWWQAQAANFVDAFVPDGPLVGFVEVVGEPVASAIMGSFYDWVGPSAKQTPPNPAEEQAFLSVLSLIESTSTDHELSAEELFSRALESGIFDQYIREAILQQAPDSTEEEIAQISPYVKTYLVDPAQLYSSELVPYLHQVAGSTYVDVADNLRDIVNQATEHEKRIAEHEKYLETLATVVGNLDLRLTPLGIQISNHEIRIWEIHDKLNILSAQLAALAGLADPFLQPHRMGGPQQPD